MSRSLFLLFRNYLPKCSARVTSLASYRYVQKTNELDVISGALVELYLSDNLTVIIKVGCERKQMFEDLANCCRSWFAKMYAVRTTA